MKTLFTDPTKRIIKHSGMSGKNCSICGKPITNAALDFSMRFYGEPLCRSCQSIKDYSRPV